MCRKLLIRLEFSPRESEALEKVNKQPRWKVDANAGNCPQATSARHFAASGLQGRRVDVLRIQLRNIMCAAL